jgi:hypothetical protein
MTTTLYTTKIYTMKKHIIILFIIIANACAAYAAKQTFEREYTYRASDNDSKNSARAIATTEMRNILLREVGEYLHSERRSINGEYSKKTEAITAGLVEMKVIFEDWDGKSYWIKASMTIDPDEINRGIAEILNDKQKTKELEDAPPPDCSSGSRHRTHAPSSGMANSKIRRKQTGNRKNEAANGNDAANRRREYTSAHATRS